MTATLGDHRDRAAAAEYARHVRASAKALDAWADLARPTLDALDPDELADLWVDLCAARTAIKATLPKVGATLAAKLADDEEIEAHDGTLLRPRRGKRGPSGLRDTVEAVRPPKGD